MDSFTILHVSDLHLAVKAGVRNAYDAVAGGHWDLARYSLIRLTSHNPTMLDAVARFAYRVASGVDLVLITGDLATSGNPADLMRAFTFVDAPAVSGWYSSNSSPTLRGASDSSGARVRLLPGNHDRYGRAPFYLPGSKTFDRVFSKYWVVGQGVQVQAILEKPHSRLAIISADFSLRARSDASGSATAYLGQGMAYKSTLDQLEEETVKVARDFAPVAVVWAVHFPPEYPKIDPELELIHGTALVRLAAGLGVNHIFAGHTHSEKIYNGSSPSVTIHCAGSACHSLTGTANSLHLCRLDVNTNTIVHASTSNFAWDRRMRDFTEV